jgi:hypothetical protein
MSKLFTKSLIIAQNTYKLIIVIFLLFSLFTFDALARQDDCYLANNNFDDVLSQIKPGNCNIIDHSDYCLKRDPRFIFKAAVIESSCLKKAPDVIKLNQDFISRIFKINPQILEAIDDKLKQDPAFMIKIIRLNTDNNFYPIKYASPNILDDESFMTDAVSVNEQNYFYASDKIKEVPSIAEIAFKADGLLIAITSEDIKHNLNLVKIAVKSNPGAIEFLDQEMKRKLLKSGYKLPKISNLDLNYKIITAFIRNNYFQAQLEDGSYKIANKAKFIPKNQILVNHNHLSKWQEIRSSGKYKLTVTDKEIRPWKKDFAGYPDLIKKIEEFLLKQNLDLNAIESLETRYLWVVNVSPLTVAFNLYKLRPAIDSDLGIEYNNLTSLTVIAKKISGKWVFSIVDSIIAKEVKMDIGYKNGYKEYEIWDIYKTNKNSKVIFKIEDRFKQYFEVFSEVENFIYLPIYTVPNSNSIEGF